MKALYPILAWSLVWTASAAIVFDGTSPYHHVRVVDERGTRVLSFDASLETRMSLADSSKGHFQYTEYFHMPWLWHTNITRILVVGLGGASVQRAYQKYSPQVSVETAEIDPLVVKVAREYFQFPDNSTNKVILSDGRLFLRNTDKKYDVLLMDAYTRNRYGSSIPHHLVTREFFVLANKHLTENGVLAYNVIGSLQGWRADVLGSVYRTMRQVFPQVYLFPATDSSNVVMVATKNKELMTPAAAFRQGQDLIVAGLRTIPDFQVRIRSFRNDPPSSFLRSPILTDDFAPVDGLLRGRQERGPGQ